MKKVFALVLMMVYGFSSVRMTINLHYCCGKLKTVEWFPAEKKFCGHRMVNHSIPTVSKPCCETKEVYSKQKQDQRSPQVTIKNSKPSFEVAPQITGTELQSFYAGFKAPFTVSPPVVSPPLFLLNRVIRV